jgi:hypothetical protein
MTSVKMSELAAAGHVLITTPAAGDLLIINDISEPLDVDKTKVISYANLVPTVNLATIFNTFFPVGCIYTTIDPTTPATVFGFGVWSAFGTGRVLVGYDATQVEFNTVEKTGGEKTHTLITAEMPAHHHHISFGAGGTQGAGLVESGTDNGSVATTSVGSGTAHNILQPYDVVYFWRRTS